MSRAQINKLILCALISAFPVASVGQGCKYTGTSEWNNSLHDVIADCAAQFPSPDRHLLLQFSADSRISIQGKTVHLKGRRIEPPAMISWSPKSDAFFVNDGEGSGMSSTFRLFRIKSTAVLEDRTIEKAAVSLYRHRTRCAQSSLDPTVYGFGWAAGGNKLYLLVQATVHEPCGPPYGFVSLVIRTSDGRILETLAKQETKVRFGSLLPSALFAP